jgi:hypothetical protein
MIYSKSKLSKQIRQLKTFKEDQNCEQHKERRSQSVLKVQMVLEISCLPRVMGAKVLLQDCQGKFYEATRVSGDIITTETTGSWALTVMSTRGRPRAR